MSIQDILWRSMLHKQHNLMRTIALVLAFTMPFCCCFVNAVAGESNSCCEKIEVVSSFETADSTQSSHSDHEKEEKSHEGCSCCIKGLVLESKWSVPNDLFGSELPLFMHDHLISNVLQQSVTIRELPPPQRVKIAMLGNSSAPSIRGVIIIEV